MDVVTLVASTLLSTLHVQAAFIPFLQDTGWHLVAEMEWTVSFTILYLSFVCYSLYDAVIMRAHSSRMEGSSWLVVVLLIVF